MASLRSLGMPRDSMRIRMRLAPREQLRPPWIILAGLPTTAFEISRVTQSGTKGPTRLPAREECLQNCARSFKQSLQAAPKRDEAASRRFPTKMAGRYPHFFVPKGRSDNSPAVHCWDKSRVD